MSRQGRGRMSGFWSEGKGSADRRVRVTAFRDLALEAAAEIAAPERKRGTPTCTGPEAAQRECGWKRGERRHGRTPEAPIAIRRRLRESAAVREVGKPGTVVCRAKKRAVKCAGRCPGAPPGGHPLDPRPLSLLCHVPERSSPSRVRCAAQKARALDCSGPFRNFDWDKGKGPFATAPPTAGLPLVGTREHRWLEKEIRSGRFGS